MSNLFTDFCDREQAYHSGSNISTKSSSSSNSLPVTADDFNYESDSQDIQDSIAKRRRHGVYYHRPPVWFPHEGLSPASGGCSIAYDSEREDLCDTESSFKMRNSILANEEEPRQWTIDWGQQIFHEVGPAAANSQQFVELPVLDNHPGILLQAPPDRLDQGYSRKKQRVPTETTNVPDFQWPLKQNLQNQSSLHKYFCQAKADLCTRLQSYKDIRLGESEKWAIQEGSLVVCIDPSYTRLECKKRRSDEFEITSGYFYVVCRLYADLWALCAKVSLGSLSKKHFFKPSSSDDTEVAFLPLCAVTLAANLSSFIRRCLIYTIYPTKEPQHPGNGLPVTPPERSHSLNASKQIFQANKHQITLPRIIFDARSDHSLEGTQKDFVPLDYTLEPLFAGLGGRRERVHQLGRRMSLRKLWYSSEDFEQTEELLLPGVQHVHGLAFPLQERKTPEYEHGRFRRRRSERESSSLSQGLGWLVSTPSQGRVRGKGRSIRDFIVTGRERLRGASRSSSAGSDPMFY